VLRVARGERFIDPSLAEDMAQERRADGPSHAPLSDRESQVLDLIVSGMRLGEIADALNVSAKTVEAHRVNIKSKLQLSGLPELLHLAVRWVDSKGIA